MGKIATNVDEQITILEKRGMDFDTGKEKAKEILLDVGYYRLGFYWFPFEKDDNHNFKDCTKFSDVVSLYYLDVDLRNVLLKYLRRIEVNFRTKLIYYASNHYKNDSIWFTDPQIMSKWFINNLDNKLYNESFKENNKQIKRHHQNYRNDRYAPTWKTFEFLTFGAILTIYNSLKDTGIQAEISSKYGLSKLSSFRNIMSTIKFIRNVCAHGGVLFDLNMPIGISKIPKTKFNNNNNQSLDAGIKAMSFILKSISELRRDEMENEIKLLFDSQKGNQIITSIIRNNVGYQI